MVSSFSQPSLYSLIILLHSVTLFSFLSRAVPCITFLIFLFLVPVCFSPFPLSFSVQSGMLERPSSVGGGPHIPPSRSAGGAGGVRWVGVGGVKGMSGSQNTHALSLHGPRSLPQESFQMPAAALSEELVTIQHIVRTYAGPEASISNSAVL